jgi:putative DNA primase/helicase
MSRVNFNQRIRAHQRKAHAQHGTTEAQHGEAKTSSVWADAVKGGENARVAADAAWTSQGNGSMQSETPEPRPPAFTDEALALGFAALYANSLRYVASMGKWLRWEAKCWRFDDTLLAFNCARRICREAAAECNKPKTATVLASAKTVAAVERLAKADRRLAATADQWDANPWLLNTPSFVVDLRTGERRKHDPHDYMTKATAVAPDASCPIPTWLRVIDRATGQDRELASYLQRLVGYSLTGSTREHALAFWYGTGANSKTTILTAITGVFGDYHHTAPIETFTATNIDRHPTELAGLRGARLVTATETEEGRRWAETRIKQLTGGDRIAARFMRQDYFEFRPQFTLIIVGNHKPGLRTVDEAIRRRFQLVPFTVTIPESERDRDLGDKLKAEWPGILHWCVQGCLKWQDKGLAPPKAVREATEIYLKAEDSLAAWIEEECERDPNAWERSSELFASWRQWAERCGVPYGDTKRFKDWLEARDIRPKQHDRNRRAGFQGLKLKSDIDTTNAYWNRG